MEACLIPSDLLLTILQVAPPSWRTICKHLHKHLNSFDVDSYIIEDNSKVITVYKEKFGIDRVKACYTILDNNTIDVPYFDHSLFSVLKYYLMRYKVTSLSLKPWRYGIKPIMYFMSRYPNPLMCHEGPALKALIPVSKSNGYVKFTLGSIVDCFMDKVVLKDGTTRSIRI
jgi:hypothetical protein